MNRKGAGELDKYITIQYPVSTPDGHGGFTNAYVNVGNVWAKMRPLSANERRNAEQNTMIATEMIRIRYRSTFKPNYRIKYGNRYFKIESILNLEEHNEWLHLMCKEVVR